jgi:hypothetical protein
VETLEALGREAERLSTVALAAAGGAFVCLFMPWIGASGNDQAGWNLALGSLYGLLALAVVLVELLFLARVWSGPGYVRVVFCLTEAAGLIGLSAVANLRWGSLLVGGFSYFEYGAWLGLMFAILLLAVGGLRLLGLWRSTP